MIPLRFKTIKPYLASLIFSQNTPPSPSEFLRILFQPSQRKRAEKFILDKSEAGDYTAITFLGHEETPFFYPKSCRWIDLCQTIDECFNPKNWHHFTTGPICITSQDVVVDCGAAEGLFSFTSAAKAKMVYAVEPIPVFVDALQKNFGSKQNVKILPYGVSNVSKELRMTNNEIFSRISPDGDLLISIKTIDELFASIEFPITLLKADIEGYEFPMLLGAEQTITRFRPKIALTVYHPQNHVAEMTDYLSLLHPDYHFKTTGISASGNPVLLQAW